MELDSFYDLDHILATEEFIPCTFSQDALKLGSLDTSTTYPDLAAGAKLELPCWMAERLGRRQFVTIDLPKCYNSAHLAKLVAGADTVPLSDWCPYYYTLGIRLSRMKDIFSGALDTEDNIDRLLPTLRKAFVERFKSIILTDHTHVDDLTSLMRRLADIEQKLVLTKEQALRNHADWRKRKTDQILATKEATSRNKRRRT